MTPERAKELLELISWHISGFLVEKKPSFPEITPFERSEVVRVWDTMGGNTCFEDALKRFANGTADLAKTFPLYKRHQDARCFKCRASLRGVKHESTDFPPTHGAWKKFCTQCDHYTFYDIQ